MIYQNDNWSLIRINKDNCECFLDIKKKSICVEKDIKEIINLLNI